MPGSMEVTRGWIIQVDFFCIDVFSETDTTKYCQVSCIIMQ